MCLFWTKIYFLIKNWSSNVNDFINGLSDSKRNRLNYDKEIRGQKKSSSSGKGKYKIRDSALFQSLPTNHDVKMGSSIDRNAFGALPIPPGLV